MNEFAYVVSLAGKRVFHDLSIQCIINHFDDLDKVRTTIKKKYNIEFEQFSSSSNSHRQVFNNITDDRDIRLVIERIKLL